MSDAIVRGTWLALDPGRRPQLTDRIVLANMRFQGRHGYYDHEMLDAPAVRGRCRARPRPAAGRGRRRPREVGRLREGLRGGPPDRRVDVVPPARGAGRGDRPRAAGRLRRRRGDGQGAQARGQAGRPARLRRRRDPAPARERPPRLIRRRRPRAPASASGPASASASGPVSARASGPASARVSGPAWAPGSAGRRDRRRRRARRRAGRRAGLRALRDDVVDRRALGDDDPGARVLAGDLSGRHGRVELLGPHPDPEPGVGDRLERARSRPCSCRSGTGTVPGPVATVISMAVPVSTLVPPGGSWVRTVPSGAADDTTPVDVEGDPEALGLQPGGGRRHAHEVRHRDLLDRRPARRRRAGRRGTRSPAAAGGRRTRRPTRAGWSLRPRRRWAAAVGGGTGATGVADRLRRRRPGCTGWPRGSAGRWRRRPPRRPAAAAAPAAAAPPPGARVASRASAMTAADAQRSFGSRASAWRVISASSGGTDGRTAVGSGIGPDSRASATEAALSPSHGRVPVSISYRTMPRL